MCWEEFCYYQILGGKISTPVLPELLLQPSHKRSAPGTFYPFSHHITSTRKCTRALSLSRRPSGVAALLASIMQPPNKHIAPLKIGDLKISSIFPNTIHRRSYQNSKRTDSKSHSHISLLFAFVRNFGHCFLSRHFVVDGRRFAYFELIGEASRLRAPEMMSWNEVESKQNIEICYISQEEEMEVIFLNRFPIFHCALRDEASWR
jgi:hypothetical protein